MGDEFVSIDPSSRPSAAQQVQGQSSNLMGVAEKPHSRPPSGAEDISPPAIPLQALKARAESFSAEPEQSLDPSETSPELKKPWDPFADTAWPPLKPSPSEEPPQAESNTDDGFHFSNKDEFPVASVDQGWNFPSEVSSDRPTTLPPPSNPNKEPPPSKKPSLGLITFSEKPKKRRRATPPDSDFKVTPPPPPPPPPLKHLLLSITPERTIAVRKIAVQAFSLGAKFGVLKTVCGQWAQLCCPNGQLNPDNVRILQSTLAQMAAENPKVAVFCDPSLMRGALDTSAIPQWSDFCSLMASLPAIEIFTLQALKVLAALSEGPQGEMDPMALQPCEANLPKLLEILQRSGLGGEGMQILTELFTPHFQVNDFMCTCHALVNYELMTNPTRLACTLVNRTIAPDLYSQAIRQRTLPVVGFKPLSSPEQFMPRTWEETSQPMDLSLPHVDRLVSLLYQERVADNCLAGRGRVLAKIAAIYFDMLDTGIALPSKSHSFTVAVQQNPTATSNSVVYTFSSDARPSLEGRNTSLVTFQCLAPDGAELFRPGHACLALQTQGGDIIFHTNYQNPDDSVFYVGITGEGVLSKFTLDPASSFSVQEPYMLSTHTLQARTAHGALAALEDLSLEAAQAKFLPLQNETREQYTAVRDIPELISQCQVAPTKIPELMPQIFQKLQPSLEILFPPEPSPA